MKKIFISFAITFALILAVGTVSAFAFTSVLSSQNLTVNGENVSCEIYNIDGNNYFKLRDIAQMLNDTDASFNVEWDASKNTISITTGASYSPVGGELVIGNDKSATTVKSSQKILINGEIVDNLSVYNIGGNNFFKLRDLGTVLRFDVGYDNETRTMSINCYNKMNDAETCEFTANGEDFLSIKDTIFNEDVIITGDTGKIYFHNCSFKCNVINKGDVNLMVMVDESCIFSKDSKCIIKNDRKDGDLIESPFPKFFTFTNSLNVICEDCLGASASMSGEAILNGIKYTVEDADYFYNASDNTVVPYNGQEYDFLIVCQIIQDNVKKIATFCIREG